MVKHIVVWLMRDDVSDEQKQEMKNRLEALGGKISELRKIEVGIDTGSGTMSLYSEFASEDDLIAYQMHADHQSVVGFVKPLVASRAVCDYEC
jgi:hypothetical protein